MSGNLAVKELNYDEIQQQELEYNNIYKFSLFEPIDEKVKEEKEKKAEEKRIQAKTKQEIVTYRWRLVKIFGTFTAIVLCFTAALFLNSKCDETATEIGKIENLISIEQSENIRLASLLESRTAITEVRNYAENVLGMVKVENYKITYLNKNEENHVVISGGKSYDDNIWDRIKKIFT